MLRTFVVRSDVHLSLQGDPSSYQLDLNQSDRDEHPCYYDISSNNVYLRVCTVAWKPADVPLSRD
jgi:hypothetical protein